MQKGRDEVKVEAEVYEDSVEGGRLPQSTPVQDVKEGIQAIQQWINQHFLRLEK